MFLKTFFAALTDVILSKKILYLVLKLVSLRSRNILYNDQER